MHDELGVLGTACLGLILYDLNSLSASYIWGPLKITMTDIRWSCLLRNITRIARIMFCGFDPFSARSISPVHNLFIILRISWLRGHFLWAHGKLTA